MHREIWKNSMNGDNEGISTTIKLESKIYDIFEVAKVSQDGKGV